MEKTINFSVFKDKIIKTNELLNVLLEKNKSSEKAQKWIQLLKTRLELSKNEINNLKLKNEALSYSLTSVEKDYDSLKVEHDQLKTQFTRLEVESGDTINNLQVNYQLANQELEECKAKLAVLEQNGGQNWSLSPTRRKRSPVKRKKSPVRKKENVEAQLDCGVMKQKINELQSEKEKLFSERGNLQLEIYELKKKLSDLQNLQETDDHLKMKEQELDKLKSKFSADIKKKDKEIDRLSKGIKNVEKQKNELLSENERLKDENCSYQLENSILHENSVQNKQIDKVKNKDGEIDRLSKEVKNLEKLMNNLQGENERLREGNCSCQHSLSDKRSRGNSITPTDEEVSEIMRQMVIPAQMSPLSNNSSQRDDSNERNLSPLENTSYEREYSPSLVNSREPSPVNPSLQRMINRRRNFKKKKRLIAKKQCRQVDLYGTLLALKKANINFIISSDSVTPPGRNPSQSINMRHPTLKKFKYFEKNKPKRNTVTKELSCELSCCKTSYMILKECDDEEDAPLLGFVGVKNEICSRQEKVIHNLILPKPLQFQKSPKKRKTYNSTVDEEESVNNLSNKSSDKIQIDNIVDICDNSIETETDEEYHSNKTKNASPVKTANKKIGDRYLEVRRSKRKRTGFMSAIKKSRVSGKNKLALTESTVSCLDASSDEENCSLPNNDPKENATNQWKSPEGENSLKHNVTEEFIFKKPTPITKSPKTTFKRPVCSTRRSSRSVTVPEMSDVADCENIQQEKTEECVPVESPKSPTPETQPSVSTKPVVIPLEKPSQIVEKMPTSKIEMLFNKLILYSAEEEALKEVVREFSTQEPEYIAEAILVRIAMDVHDRADTKYSPAPLMTDVQRTMLGFMSKLEKSNVIGVFDSYLTLAEQRLLTCNVLQEFGPITRLYLAVCKLKKNLTRMRKLCCDVFYFCGDFAVPFFFTVLTSWTEVLPHEADSKDFPLARVLVQVVYLKDCNKPGYNLMPLRDLLTKFYGYPSERWDLNEFFKELFDAYLRNPVRPSDFPLLLYCKNCPEKWVYEKIEEHLKPLVNLKIQDNFKATLIIFIGNLYNRFSSKSEINYLPKIREWFLSLVNEEAADVVKRCVYLCLNRLKKK